MRKAIYHHMHGAGGDWEGQVIEVELPEEQVESRYTANRFGMYVAYKDGERGRVYEQELTWLDEVKPSLEELLDAVWAQEDVVLVDEEGNLTEAGMLYIVDSRRLAAE